MKANKFFALAISALFIVTAASAQIDTAILRPLGYHPSDVIYFNTPYLANSMAMGGEWRQFPVGGNNFGDTFNYHAPENASQFINGYPQFLGNGTTTGRGPNLRALLFGVNINNTDIRPPGWPLRDNLAKGHYVLTWKGNADIRLQSGTLLTGPGESTVAATGSFLNGRRTYLCDSIPETLEIRQITTPITEIKVFLPALDNPATPAVNERLTTSLEGQFFHPLLLQRIADADFGFIRFMDWGKTNASPQQDWIDRRVPNHVFQAGIINNRAPNTNFGAGDRETGVAWEHMVALCNATGRNMWINIPHMATADYITKLANLIRFGSDGVNPLTSVQANPAFPPLNSNLKVFIEYSNEIWSSGFAFAQGNFAEEQASNQGITKAQFNARKFCDTWRVFEQVFGGTSRLVRVAATFTANDTYTGEFLQEIATYGAAATGRTATRPDVLAVTTYFGNDIQGFVNDKGYATGKLFSDPYWTSSLFNTHLETAFDEWKRRILAGDAAAGSGPDATGIGGGFSTSLKTLMQTKLGFQLPIVAYEGGPSLFTDTLDAGNTTADDGVTIFVEEMNRRPRIAEVYRIHLDTAKSKGLWTHNPYTDTSTWSRFGQWGHLEVLEQPPASAPKYSLMLEHFNTFTTLRHIDNFVGSVPQFSTAAALPAGIAGSPYTTDIATSGGNGARTVTVIGSLLGPGLTVGAGPTAGTLRVSGTPITSKKNFVFARVNDADGDPAWRVFTLEIFGGPGTLVQSDFRGTNPSRTTLPWMPTFVISPKVTWSGWNFGAGIVPQDGDNGLVFSVSGGGTSESLTQAIADNQFLTATITPAQGPIDLRGGKIRFFTRRIPEFSHAPRQYALFTSIGGFATAGAAIYTSPASENGSLDFNFDEVEHVVTIPSTSAFQAVNSALEIRIYAFAGEFDGHRTSLTGFKLAEFTATPFVVPGAAVARTRGGTPSAATLATVTDDEDPPGTLVVTATAVPTGISITNIANNNGTITATVGASCSITNGAKVVTLQAQNSAGTTSTANFTVNVASNTVPTLGTYGDVTIAAGGSTTVTPSAPPADNGTVTVTPTASSGYTGTLTANSTTGVVSIGNANAGTFTITVAAKDNCNANAVSKTFTLTVNGSLAAPAGFTATATQPNSVSVVWSTVPGATSYEVQRTEFITNAFAPLSPTVTVTNFTDTTVTGNKSYLYRVRALAGGLASPFSAVDVATTVIFSDPALGSGTTVIKAAHIAELRTAVAAMRTAAVLGAATFADNPLTATTKVKASHITELRTALDQARSSLGLTPALTYTDSAITAGTTKVKAVHVQQLRDGVK